MGVVHRVYQDAQVHFGRSVGARRTWRFRAGKTRNALECCVRVSVNFEMLSARRTVDLKMRYTRERVDVTAVIDAKLIRWPGRDSSV